MGVEDKIIEGIENDKNSHYLILILILISFTIYGSVKFCVSMIDELKEVDEAIQETMEEVKEDAHKLNIRVTRIEVKLDE